MPRLLFPGLIAALTLAACSDTSPHPTAPDPAQSATTQASVASSSITASEQWNLRTRMIIGRRATGPNDAARAFALVSVAQYDAVVAAGNARARGVHASDAGAAATASAVVLAALYPVEQQFIDSALTADAAYYPKLPSERETSFASGGERGRAIAAAVLARAATDGSTAIWTGTVPVGPGIWIPAPAPAKPQGALWGNVRPWLLSSGKQFRPSPPPAFGSPAEVDALAEVQHYSDTRTPEQLQIAQFWATGAGPGGPAGYFGNLAVQLAGRQHLDERASARMLAVLHMAIMDASIGCYDGKYFYWYIRPYQADLAITTPVARPNFPSYPSAHSCLSSAAGRVLTGFFPASADTLHALVEQAGVSRIYAGLHFRFDVDAGRQLGTSVGELALKLAPHGHEPIRLQ